MVAGGKSATNKGGSAEKKTVQKLQSVQEADELVNSDLPPSPRPEGCNRFFGIKSHLHNFYEHITEKDPQLYEEYEEYR